MTPVRFEASSFRRIRHPNLHHDEKSAHAIVGGRRDNVIVGLIVIERDVDIVRRPNHALSLIQLCIAFVILKNRFSRLD